MLSNGFAVPGTESYRAQLVLQHHFGDRSDGEFLVVFDVADARERLLRARLQATVDRAASVIPTAHAGRVQAAGRHVVYADVVSQLDLAQAKQETGRLLSALGRPRGVRAYRDRARRRFSTTSIRSSTRTSAGASSRSRFPRR